MVRRSSTQAYVESHPQAGYETARTEGSRLFRDPRITSLIQAALSEERERLESNGRRVSDTLAAMAFTPMSAVFNKDGSMIAPTDLPHSVSLAVKKISRREILGNINKETGKRQVIGQMLEIEMHDRVQPLRLLGLECGMFSEKMLHTADNVLLQALREGRERALATVRRADPPGELRAI